MEWGTVQLWEVGNCDNKGRGQKVDCSGKPHG